MNTDITYDVCIIGAGAAGITVALELAKNTLLKIALLEAGGEHYERRAQNLFQGETEGDRHPPLRRARFSGLGGSTQIWAGWCRPLDKEDFEARDYIVDSGWPIRFWELQPGYRRANEICGLGPFQYDLEHWQHLLKGKPLLHHPDLAHRIYQVRKLRFNHYYHESLKNAGNISLFLFCPIMKLLATQNGRRVAQVEIASYDGKRKRLGARQFVLATGGLENARLLLLSGPSPEQALGNQHDLVGRYFTEHGFVDSGWFWPTKDFRDLLYYFPIPHSVDGKYGTIRPVITLSPGVLKREKLCNGAMFFYPAYESHPVFASDSVKATLELWESFKHQVFPGSWGDLFKRAACRPHHIFQAILRKTFIRNAPRTQWRLRFYYECTPQPDNRVMLSQHKDQFDRPTVRLCWRLADQDLDSAYRFHRYLSGVLEKAGAGHLTFFDDPEQWRANTESGKHPMGTTRMHDNPAYGVVDRNCQVHGLENLFIAGSSVFPTGGYANPTLTIVALAVRLAEYLQTRISEAG